MTSGKMNHINKFLVLLVLFFNLVFNMAAHATEHDSTVAEVMNLFSQQKKSTVDFKEEKHTSFLEQPIISSGYLEFIAPDRLAKYITVPEKISNEINGNQLVIKTSSETHTINLKEHPEFSIILTSIINLLSGNYEALKNNFTIKFKGQVTSWELELLPRDSFIRGHIDSIGMHGNKNKLTKIMVTEANKDYSVTHISNHR
ncbi:MAG: outer membrane lipoprotein carrier protein LolA [Gammaproteobacteria bacterium]|nr:outer membrane lipoprotein carrier protein LolA [Gammaproteobacteria bacterium]